MNADNQLKNYDFIEGIEFDELMPKAIDKAPGTTGEAEKDVHLFRGGHLGADSMQVIDILAFYESEPGPGPEPGPVPPKPQPTQNDSAQTQTANNIADAAAGGSGYTAGEGETINNFTIPSNAPKAVTVTGPIQNGATITNNSPKQLTVKNTSEEPVDVVIESSDSAAGVQLEGKFNNIYLNGKSLPTGLLGGGPEVTGAITVEDNGDKFNEIAINATFEGDKAAVNYEGDKPMTITNGNNGEEGNLTIYAPNSTVTVGSKGNNYNEVTATVSENTLILKTSFFANKLNVLKGKVFIYGSTIDAFTNDFVNKDIVVESFSLDITNSNFTSCYNSNSAGTFNFVEDITTNKFFQFGAAAKGSYEYNLNGHVITCGNSSAGSLHPKFKAHVTVNGDGKIVNNANSYCVFVDGADASVTINGGEFEGYTHVVYVYNGVANICGGTFKMLGEGGELDPKGHYKFLLNCYDANYTGGTANIVVTGGKFYNFDPSEAYCEPGGESVSFVDAGYKVIESVEEGVPVFTVVPSNFEGDGEPIEGGEDHNW